MKATKKAINPHHRAVLAALGLVFLQEKYKTMPTIGNKMLSTPHPKLSGSEEERSEAEKPGSASPHLWLAGSR